MPHNKLKPYCCLSYLNMKKVNCISKQPLGNYPDIAENLCVMCLNKWMDIGRLGNYKSNQEII